MFRIVIFIAIFVITFQHGSSQNLTPKYTLENDGTVEDFFVDGENLYFGGSMGELICLDRKSKTITKSLALPTIEDFMGDETHPKITCLDRDESTGKIIIVSQGKRGFRNVFVVDNWKLEQVITDIEQKWMITESRITKPNHIIITLLSNEIILFNFLTKEIVYQKQIGFYTLSDMDLSSTKNQMASADESGSIHLINLTDGEVVREYTSENLDKVNRVSFGGNVIACGGQDRRLSFYNTQSEQAWHVESKFLIYSLCMDDQGKLVIYNADESNTLSLFNINLKHEVAKLNGHKGILTQGKFINNELITSSEDGKICWWDLTPFY